jgi:DNA-binding response OmpR family regulator
MRRDHPWQWAASVKVLVLEDNARVARFLAQIFREGGYVVDSCDRGADAISQATATPYDVIVLDWMVPDVDGVAVCRALRRAGVTTPILMLTARGATSERVTGLDAGADDYMTKPFEIDELLARVRALVRRASEGGRLRCGDLEIDRMAHRATLSGQPLALSARELAVLITLASKPEQVVTRTQLMGHVWSATFDSGSNIIDVHMSRLREKLGAHRWMIETVRGKGYRLRAARP